MSNKLHSLIFLFFIISFIIIAPLALLYSEGYRFNFEDNEVVKTGGLSLKVKPQVRAEVYLNGKLKKKVNGWTYSAYVSALTPDTYDVEVKRDGFHPWSKTLKIEEKKVTEAKHILLVPTEPTLEVKLENVDSFSVSPDETKIFYQDSEQKSIIYDIEEETEIPLEYPTSTLVKWGPESERALIETPTTHFIFNNQEFTKLNLPSDLKEIHFNPDEPSELFYTREKSQDKLLKTDYTTKNQNSTTTISNFLSYDFTPQGIVWLSSSGQIHRSDFSGAIQSTLNSEAFSVQKSNYEIISEGGKILIVEDQTLYSLTGEEAKEEFKQLATNVNQVKLSPHIQKAALISDHEIEIVYLNKKYGQPQREKYEKDFLTRFSQPIEKVTWFDSHHLVFKLENNEKIKISGTDNRSTVNIVDYLNSNSKRWYWNNSQESFYLLENGTLYQNSPLET